MVATCWGHACKPPLTRECSLLTLYWWTSTLKPWPNVENLLRFPCLCCDGPGPNDCVICSEGILTFDILRAFFLIFFRRVEWFGCEDLTGHIQSKIEKSHPVYTVSPMRSRGEPCIFPSYTRLCMLWSWQWWGWNLHGRRWKLLNHVTMCHYRQQLLILHFQGLWHHCGLTGRRTRQLFLWICGRRGLMWIYEFWCLMLKQEQALSANIVSWWRWT